MNNEQPKNPTAYRLGRQIAELRQLHGYSQRDVAAITGLKQAQIYNMESGRYSTTVEAIAKVLDVLDCRLTISAIPRI